MHTDKEQYVQFQIDREKYAIHISEIHEIIRMQTINELPNVVHHIKGIINIRGRIVPVVSLRSLFGFNEDKYQEHTRIIVVDYMRGAVGLIVDRVDRIVTFDSIRPLPNRIGEIKGVNFVDIGMVGDDLVGILKLDKILMNLNNLEG